MTKAPYSPPKIERLTPTSIGKHSLVNILSGAEWPEEDIDVQGLLKEFGSPLFLLSEEALRTRFKTFLDAFTVKGVDTIIGYSYKTNYLPAVCSILHEEGAWAEVVSGLEYSLARSLGVPGENIVFNGPYKTREEIAEAIKDRALLNIDGFDELSAVKAVAADLGKTARIGLRINFAIGSSPWTKFGFNADGDQALSALKQVKKAGEHLSLEALHNHSGTYQVDPKVYGAAARVLIKTAKQARGLGLSPTIMDLGGGYPSNNHLKPEFDLPGGSGEDGSTLKPYAEEILRRLVDQKKQFGGRPKLILEPGRAIIDAAMRLACSVVATKEIPNQGDAVILDAGVNILPTAYWYDHNIGSNDLGVESIGGDKKTYSLYGPLCMQIDKIRDKVTLPTLQKGSPLLIENVGAYCQTQSMQFIQPRPATVLLGPNGPELIQRREGWRDFFARDTIPERLRPKDCSF